MATGVVKHLDKLCTVEHRIFVALVKCDGTMGASACTEHAEHAATKVVLILHEAFLFLAVGSLVKLAGHLDTAVRASHLAESATHALVLILLVMGHCERTTEAFEHFVRITVFGILFGDFRSEELAHGCFQTSAKALQATYYTTYITFFFHEFKLNEFNELILFGMVKELSVKVPSMR